MAAGISDRLRVLCLQQIKELTSRIQDKRGIEKSHATHLACIDLIKRTNHQRKAVSHRILANKAAQEQEGADRRKYARLINKDKSELDILSGKVQFLVAVKNANWIRSVR